MDTTAPTRPSQIAASSFSNPGRATPEPDYWLRVFCSASLRELVEKLNFRGRGVATLIDHLTDR